MTREEFLRSTYARLAALTGTNPEHWSRYCSGKVSPKLVTIARLANKLDMPPERLAEGILCRIEEKRSAGKHTTPKRIGSAA